MRFGRRPRIYVAGPYTNGDPLTNTNRAIDAAEAIVNMGGDPFVPHLSHYRHERHPHDYQFWIEEDLRWLQVCDALYRIPGESSGADKEVQVMRTLKRPVFDTLDALALWIRDWNAEPEAWDGTLRDLISEAHTTALSKGWYEPPDSIRRGLGGNESLVVGFDRYFLNSCLMLAVSELGEAAEGLRRGDMANVAEEMADCVIRLADTSAAFKIDLETAICQKLVKNRNRPRMHGGKKF